MNDMSYRLSQSEFRAKHLSSYDAAAVEQYEAWTLQIGEVDELACLADIGVLHWNEVEHTWDCPVHGGRFTADGQRIYGPPESDMMRVE